MSNTLRIDDIGRGTLEIADKRVIFDLYDVADEIGDAYRLHGDPEGHTIPKALKDRLKAIIADLAGVNASAISTGQAMFFQSRIHDAMVELEKKTSPTAKPDSSDSTA